MTPDLLPAIPLWCLLIVYGIFLVLFFVYTIFNLYHLLRFGTAGIGLYAVIAVFLFGSGILLFGSFMVLSGFDWTASLNTASLFQSDQGSLYGL